MISRTFIGRLGDSELSAGAGLGLFLTNIIALGVGLGFVDASGGFISQSYGSGKFEECGLYLMRTKLVTTVLMLTCAVVFLKM